MSPASTPRFTREDARADRDAVRCDHVCRTCTLSTMRRRREAGARHGAPTMSTLATRAKVGFWLAVVLALADIVGAFVPGPPEGDGPPIEVLIFSGLMGVI